MNLFKKSEKKETKDSSFIKEAAMDGIMAVVMPMVEKMGLIPMAVNSLKEFLGEDDVVVLLRYLPQAKEPVLFVFKNKPECIIKFDSKDHYDESLLHMIPLSGAISSLEDIKKMFKNGK